MSVKRMFALAFIFPCVIICSCISRPAFFNKGYIDKETAVIAVLHFKDYNGSQGNNSGALVENVFEGTLLKRGYKVVDMEKTAAVTDYDFLDKNKYPSQWFIDTGKALGVEYMLYGSVHDYSVYQSYSTFIYIFGWLEVTASVGVTARLVSCKTGEVVWCGSLTRKSYTFNDAVDEVVDELVMTIKYRSPAKVDEIQN